MKVLGVRGSESLWTPVKTVAPVNFNRINLFLGQIKVSGGF